MLGKFRGQSTLEYALIIATVIVALLALRYYMTRGMQGRLKESTDQIGRQFDPQQGFTNAWQNQGTGLTTTQEDRVAGTGGDTTTTYTASETVTRGEYEDWGGAGNIPGQRY